MSLIENWRRVARYSWSIRLILLSGLFTGFDIILPLYVERMPRGIFAGLSVFVAVAATVLRLVAQPVIERRKHPRNRND